MGYIYIQKKNETKIKCNTKRSVTSKDYFRILLFFCVCIISLFILGYSNTFAQSRGDYDKKKCDGEGNFGFGLCIVARIVGKENKDTGIIQTDLDTVNRDYGEFNNKPELTISNTLSDTKTKLASYLERIAFLGLSASVALLIYNGLLLVLSPMTDEQLSNVKKRIVHIIAGILLISGFYFILKIILGILVDIITR